MIGAVVLAAQLTWGAQAIPILTRADPTAGAQARTELRVVAPLLFGAAHLAGGRVMIHATLNFEGWTMPGGQLATGDWGEGFNDRRHPHTLAHELMVSATDVVVLPGALHWSLSAGKGFAPYGSDDPMNRPALIYPVNHHWSQVLERYVVIAGASLGPVTLEYGRFNGDEPENYAQWPALDRFGDSWSARAFVRPMAGLEIQGSFANVRSPEHRGGSGLRHTKISVSGGIERRTSIGDVYALGEWARTVEGGFFLYYSGLFEAQLTRRARRVYLRLERTDRPEEELVVGNAFRSNRPHSENSNLGVTRWTTLTAGAGVGFGGGRVPVRLEGIVETEFLHVTSITPGSFFDPQTRWGRNDLWTFSVGLRILAREPAHRMGRYGIATRESIHSLNGRTHDEM